MVSRRSYRQVKETESNDTNLPNNEQTTTLTYKWHQLKHRPV